MNQNVQTINTPSHSAATKEPLAVRVPDHSQERTNLRTSSTTSLTASPVTDTLHTSSVDLPADIASDSVDTTFRISQASRLNIALDAPVAPPRSARSRAPIPNPRYFNPDDFTNIICVSHV